MKEFILPTLTGQMGVLKDHIAVLTGLDIGRAVYNLLYYVNLFYNDILKLRLIKLKTFLPD